MRFHHPLDPDCPAVTRYREEDDPIMRLSGCADEFAADFARAHRSRCDRCVEYGAENVEVAD